MRPPCASSITDSTLPAGTVLENDALVTADTFELNTTDNLRFTQNTVLAAADMSLTKSNMGEVVIGVNPLTGELIVTDTPNAVTAGMLLRYQLSATNNGPSQALNVTVKDTMPSTNFVNYVRAYGADRRPDVDVQQNIRLLQPGHHPGRRPQDLRPLRAGEVLGTCGDEPRHHGEEPVQPVEYPGINGRRRWRPCCQGCVGAAAVELR